LNRNKPWENNQTTREHKARILFKERAQA
jgi:hypothetical protein